MGVTKDLVNDNRRTIDFIIEFFIQSLVLEMLDGWLAQYSV